MFTKQCRLTVQALAHMLGYFCCNPLEVVAYILFPQNKLQVAYDYTTILSGSHLAHNL